MYCMLAHTSNKVREATPGSGVSDMELDLFVGVRNMNCLKCLFDTQCNLQATLIVDVRAAPSSHELILI